MIDIENQIFNPIAKELRKRFPGINVSSSYVHAPKSFPHASIVERDNYTTRQHIDSGDKERFASLMYEVNVYSDDVSKKKSECRAILNVIDEIMYSLNFRRTVMTPVPNMDNATIFRLTARYEAETDGTQIYRR